MPRYFFNTRDGVRMPDTEGMELEGLSAARRQAIVYAGDVMHSEPDVLGDGRDFVVEVTDQNDLLLFTITAFATNAPAGGDTR